MTDVFPMHGPNCLCQRCWQAPAPTRWCSRKSGHTGNCDFDRASPPISIEDCHETSDSLPTQAQAPAPDAPADALTDERILTISGLHAPEQGEAFDYLAFGRAVAADRIEELTRERDKYRAAHTAMNVREARASARATKAEAALAERDKLLRGLKYGIAQQFNRVARSPEGCPMTDAEIIAIRDEHLPSQGEPFDCLAFGRAVVQAALRQAVPREPTEWQIQDAIRYEIAKCVIFMRKMTPPTSEICADALANSGNKLRLTIRAMYDAAPAAPKDAP
jgi:hypothetical protein